MRYASVSVLVPLKITADMIKPGTSVPEPDPARGEAAWVSGGNYAPLAERVSNHSVYTCVQVANGRNVPPERDPDYWKYKGPSNRFAPCDDYSSTPALATGTLTYVMQPGFFRDVRLDGLQSDRAAITVRDAPGGTITKAVDVELWEQAMGLWELLFEPLGKRDQLELRDIPISPTAELTVTLTGAPTAIVGLGTMHIGEWLALAGTGGGGTEYGAEAEPKSYSYIESFPDGTWRIQKRYAAIDLSFSCVIDASQAVYAAAILKRILDLPVSVSATDTPGYEYLNGVGLVTGKVRAENAKEAKLTVKVRGAV